MRLRENHIFGRPKELLSEDYLSDNRNSDNSGQGCLHELSLC